MAASSDPQVEEVRQALGSARAEVTRLEQVFLDLTGRKRHQEAAHGTDTGYYAHRRQWGTKPCNECKAAHSTAERIRQRRLKGEDTGDTAPTLF
jgi:hypothetical protein